MTRTKSVPKRHPSYSVEKFTAFKNRFNKWAFRADYGGDVLARSTSNHGVLMICEFISSEHVRNLLDEFNN